MPLFDVNDAIGAVSRDLADGFEGIFAATGDLQPVGVFAEEAVGTLSEDVSVLAWEWSVIHVGSLQGTPATGRELTLRGMTVIDGSGAELQFSRYIDWLGLYADLGAVTIARPPVDDRNAIPENVPFPVPDN